MVAHTCNPALKRLRLEDHKFKASLGYIVSSRPAYAKIARPCLQKKKEEEEKAFDLLYQPSFLDIFSLYFQDTMLS
jgi:hypothetical protein